VRVEREFYINRWLVERGFLRFRSENPESLEELADGTTAFALDPCRIFLHRKGSFSRGVVRSDEEYETLRHDLVEQLSGVEYNGRKIMNRVLTKEAVYPPGPFFHRAADILCVPNDGIDLKASLKPREAFGRSALTGMHKHDDALFFFRGEARAMRNNPNISEIAGFILELFNDG